MMHWVILPGGRALNLAHATWVTEEMRYNADGQEVPVMLLYMGTGDSDHCDVISAGGADRDFLRHYIGAILAHAGTWT